MTDQRVGQRVTYAGSPPVFKVVGGAGGPGRGGMPVKKPGNFPASGGRRAPIKPTSPSDKGRNSGVE